MSELADSAVNILLVDDSPSVRTVLRTLLCGLGVTRIYEATDREEAFIMARVCRPDLALIDHDLGRTSGVELIAAFRDTCLLYTSPSPRDLSTSRMPSSA